ncbi:hypothetical protein [Erythrobacter sp. F6033]|uniref:hypothetical protein n=1 Tax=Erythrobacter sp. F6033 TaxID=2926401 RepID=UPI001FF67696|nr:hypothetical protein [Erythrobacter sp. F6033]MCK0127532.1 hypothetical protein [Erythrobacter sp. F6033]
MSQYRSILVATALIATGISISPEEASAQVEADKLVPGAACLAREAADGRKVAVIAPVQSAPTLIAKGFAVESCERNFAGVGQRRKWRDEICELASEPDAHFQAQAEKIMGERPAVLCAMAEIVSSPWGRSGGRNK